ncbi:bifunctional 5,10-methylenetetrahydrofolate dehydrogenase/5,10-methenyltetrahydrofolate cyclohydrolase [candidate division WWE3 bacterium]|nr:bifunctional 5,10-methylenetetrahydrofolate dehydrogenase/5,10-methenyltetrahydrofolate cyclohydrolase [candidate division WWE3 bacterium]
MFLFDSKRAIEQLDIKVTQQVAQKSKLLVGKVLAIVQIGDNTESKKYIELKKRYGLKFGIDVLEYKISSDLDDLEIVKIMYQIAGSASVGGVIVQLPLPRPSLNAILNFIPVEKDVDLLSEKSCHIFYSGVFDRLSPAVLATEYFIDSIKEKLEKLEIKKSIILGGGNLIGKPVEFYLRSKGFMTEILLDYTSGINLNANLIVLGVGKPNLVKGDDIAKGANVIDFGSSIVEGRVVGDLDLTSNLEHLGCVATSPGGLGPLVVRFLFLNFLKAI